MSSAAAQLQSYIECYVGTQLAGATRKLVPSGCSSRAASCSHAVAFDAAEVLGSVPYFVQPWVSADGVQVASVPQAGPSTSSVFGTVTSTYDWGDVSTDAAHNALKLVLYLCETVERHIGAFVTDVSAGPSFVFLHPTEPPSSVDGADGGKGLCATTCGGGPAVNFIAWVALEVYRLLARDAEFCFPQRPRQIPFIAFDVGGSMDRYLQWDRQTGARCALAAAELAAMRREAVRHTPDCRNELGRLVRDIARSSAEDFDDVFTSHPHFFFDFSWSELLPQLHRRCVTEADLDSDRTKRIERLRGMLSGTSASELGAGSVVLDGPQGCSSKRCWIQSFWVDAAAILEEDAVALCETDSDSGGLASSSPTPTQTSAYMAASVATSLAEGLLQPLSRWLQKVILYGRPAHCWSSRRDEGSVREAEPFVQAVQRAMGVGMRAVQVVSFPLCDGGDAEVPHCPYHGGLAGCWLVPSQTSPLRVRPSPSFGLRRQRRAVVLPGLSIAATHITSLSPSHKAWDRASGEVNLETAAPAGTCVWSPAHALTQLTLTEEEIDAWAPALCCSAPHSPLVPVSIVPAAALRAAEELLLFEDFPTVAATLEHLRAALDDAVPQGWVVLVVQASVPKAVQSCVRDTWGSSKRPVLLVSAVGHWGLQQLAIRFQVHPCTSATDLSHLRGVRRGNFRPKGDESGGCAGVVVVPLRSQAYAPSVSCTQPPHSLDRRYAAGFTELRDHYVVVIGECASNSDAAFAPSEVATKERVRGEVGEPVELSSPPNIHDQPPSRSSMYWRGDSEESSSEDGGSDASSSSFSFSETPSEEWTRACYSDPGVPTLPSVGASVLIGSATRGGLQELIYDFWCSWRRLLHALLLPPPLNAMVETSGERSANVQAIRYLDALLTPPLTSHESPLAVTAVARSPDEMLILRVFREALWSHELLALQHAPGGPTLDESWRILQSWVSLTEDVGVRCVTTVAPTESWLTVRSSYLALAQSLDELCGTVVLGYDSRESC